MSQSNPQARAPARGRTLLVVALLILGLAAAALVVFRSGMLAGATKE